MREGRKKALPIAHHQEQPEQQHSGQAIAQQALSVTFQPWPGAIEKCIRAPQRNPKEQVFVQDLGPDPLALGRCLGRVTGALFGIHGADQVMTAQEAH
ncbi:hypothetical protein D3C77_480220 [compost metagenome]